MNTLEVFHLLQSDKTICQILLGVFPYDKIPSILSYPCALVVNLDPSTEPGSHWVALYFNLKGHCDYFDSYGRKPEHLLPYIQRNSTSFTFNNIRVQNFSSVSCGQMCVYFLIWRARGVTFKQIIKSMNNDQSVVDFINSLFCL